MRTFEQRKRIPLSEKSNWQQMRSTMLKRRAISANFKCDCSDLIGNMYIVEEVREAIFTDSEESSKVLPSASTQESVALAPPARYEDSEMDLLVDCAHQAGFVEKPHGQSDLFALLGNDATWTDFADKTEAGKASKKSLGTHSTTARASYLT